MWDANILMKGRFGQSATAECRYNPRAIFNKRCDEGKVGKSDFLHADQKLKTTGSLVNFVNMLHHAGQAVSWSSVFGTFFQLSILASLNGTELCKNINCRSKFKIIIEKSLLFNASVNCSS